MLPPPRDLAELEARARALTGRALDELAASHGLPFQGREGARTKGKTGALLEQILGATGGSHAVHDFPELGVELKTIPVDPSLHARESTYVCTLQLTDADRAEWATSWARSKLSHVLWVPIVLDADEERASVGRIASPVFWRPTPEQDAILASDFEDALGQAAIGGIESLTARTGRWLHVRPKAASSRDRTWALGGDEGERIATVPRGFYLRQRFTTAILADPGAIP